MIILVNDEGNATGVTAALAAILETAPSSLDDFLDWAKDAVRAGATEASYTIPVSEGPPLRARLATLTRMGVVQIEPTLPSFRHLTLQLTKRQVEVAKLAVEGHSNSEIGFALGISHQTVKRHLAAIYRRLDVSSRTELAVRLLRRT